MNRQAVVLNPLDNHRGLVFVLWLLWSSSSVHAFHAQKPSINMRFMNKIALLHPGARTMYLTQVRFARREVATVDATGARKRVLVVVESPTKAVTISKYLADQDKQYVVQSTMGHLRDLRSPQKRAETADAKLSTAVRTFGVDIEHNFEPAFVNIPDKTSTIAKLKTAAKEVDEVILATDGDREGEAISWHVKELLKLKIPFSRAVFHEVTKDAIVRAFTDVGDINMQLVESQIGRRMLDRLTGFSLSRVFMQLCLGKSAGRVQSAALAVICEREEARLRFVPMKYFSITANCTVTNRKTPFPVKLIQVGDRPIAASSESGKISKSYALTDPNAAQRIHAWLSDPSITLQVSRLKQQQVKRKPPPPLITSTLQQEASRRLGMSPSRTMAIAAQLYEEGYITYHRTDDPVLSASAQSIARQLVTTTYGDEFVGGAMKTNKPKNSQEAHEAIRPAIVKNSFVQPEKLNVAGDLKRLYSLVYERSIASVMADSVLLQTSCDIEAQHSKGHSCTVDETLQADTLVLRATGSVVKFEGFRRISNSRKKSDLDGVYNDGDGFSNAKLPELKEGMNLKFHKPKAGGEPVVHCNEHATKPPARFSESAFIKELEHLGIGRPSTYANILDKLKQREYIHVHTRSIHPTIPGMAATAFLRKYYSDIVDTSFTAKMEATLDEIAQGSADRVSFLREFYLGDDGLENKVAAMKQLTRENSREPVALPALKDSRYAVFIGPHKPFARDLETNKTVTLVDALINDPATVNADAIHELFERHAANTSAGVDCLGIHPTTGMPMTVRTGSYGPYILLGSPGNGKPTFHNIPDSYVDRMTPEIAVEICDLPKELGQHPTVHVPVILGMGRHGMFVRVGNSPTKYDLPENFFSPTEVSLEVACSVLPGTVTLQQAQPIKLGEHKKKDVYAGIHKRVAYVIHGDGNPVFLPQNSINDLMLADAIKYINKPPKFRFPTNRKWKFRGK